MRRLSFCFGIPFSIACAFSDMAIGQEPDLSVDVLIEGMRNRASIISSGNISMTIEVESGPRNALTDEDIQRILANAHFYSKKSSELRGREVAGAKERRGKFLREYRESLVAAKHSVKAINYKLVFDNQKCRLENIRKGVHGIIYIEDGQKSIRYVMGKRENEATIDVPGVTLTRVQRRLPLARFSGQMPQKLLEYLDRHRSETQLVGRERAGGMTLYMLRVEIPFDGQFSAFKAIARGMFCGCSVKIWVSPEEGFVVPKIQIRYINNVLAKEFLSEQFRKLWPGVWFPFVTKRISYYEDGENVRFEEVWQVKDAVINGHISDDAFTIDFPIGTRVVDKRTKPVVVFIVEENPRSQIDNVNQQKQ